MLCCLYQVCVFLLLRQIVYFLFSYERKRQARYLEYLCLQETHSQHSPEGYTDIFRPSRLTIINSKIVATSKVRGTNKSNRLTYIYVCYVYLARKVDQTRWQRPTRCMDQVRQQVNTENGESMLRRTWRLRKVCTVLQSHVTVKQEERSQLRISTKILCILLDGGPQIPHGVRMCLRLRKLLLLIFICLSSDIDYMCSMVSFISGVDHVYPSDG